MYDTCTEVPLRNRLSLVALLALLTAFAHADIGVVVADPTHLGATRFTAAGHALVFLSGVCPDAPTHARLCRPGEQGSVVTTAPNFHEIQPYGWNLLPASLYLQGMIDPGNRLLYGSHYLKQALELHARIHFFRTVCEDAGCPELPHSYWRELIGVTIERDVFIYAVPTSHDQDQAAVDWLNRNPNVNRYNPVTNNCADFAASLINAIFPHSVHRDLLNDVGMMTPKAAARSFTLWALKHPEVVFYSYHFSQQPGDIPRSGPARSGTETVIHTKKYVIPAIVLGDWELPTSIFASYLFTGRFNLYTRYAQHPPDASGREEGVGAGGLPDATPGTAREWASYRERFAAFRASPEARDTSSTLVSMTAGSKHFFPAAYGTATASIDAGGLPWLSPDTSNPRFRVGISSENLLAPSSDPQLAFQLILGRVGYALTARDRMRESIQELRQDWSLLERAQSRLRAVHGGVAILAKP